MGVHGLWRLIEPSGKPVPLETLENKVLAVDVSIWLHQAIKGFQDSKGAPIPNAHLLGIYHRVCKLLYFKIKPVFVFDGGVPVLKKQTIAKRNQQKSKNTSEADKLQKQLLETLMKHTAVSKVLLEQTKASITAPSKNKTDTLFALPPTELDSTVSSEEETEATSESTDSSPTKNWDLHTIDMTSAHFKSLPVDVRHEILTELKETRKQNSWGRLHELPKQSDDFSSYQMKRLLKRQAVQAALEEAAQEMGGTSLSLAELESILKDQGIQTTTDSIGKRIASDENTRYLFIKDVKQAMERAKQRQLGEETNEEAKSALEEAGQLQQAIELSLQGTVPVGVGKEECRMRADMEEEEQLEQAIALSLQEAPSTSGRHEEETIDFCYLEDDFDSGSDVELESVTKKTLSSAQSYMMEYSGLTPSEIAKIIDGSSGKRVPKKTTIDTALKLIHEEEREEKSEEPTEESAYSTKKALGANEEEREEKSEESIEESAYSTKKALGANEEEREEKSEEPIEESAYSTKKALGANEEEREEKSEEPIEESAYSTKKALGANEEEREEKSEEPIEESAYSTKKALGANEEKREEKSEEPIEESAYSTKKALGANEEKREEKSEEPLEESAYSTKKTLGANEEKREEKCEEPLEESAYSTKKALGANEEKREEKSEEPLEESAYSTKKALGANEENQIDSSKISNELEEVCEIISDSDESSDFQEVAELKEDKSSMEIVIDLNKGVEDDIFEDIFTNEEISTSTTPDENKHQSNINEKEMGKTVGITEVSKLSEDKTNVSAVATAEGNNIDNKTERDEVAEEKGDDKIAPKKFEENSTRPTLTIQEMTDLKNTLQKEKTDLLVEKSTKERLASNITDQMYQEAQELLELFGVPYIIAPMEAEAQCAFLDAIDLTDGTITDDSDVWLFGGRTVYKNFFNQSKYVMEFKSENIRHNFKLSREQMILLALLVGSDYTTGIQGVGPVTALEILAAFPPPKLDEVSLSQLISGLKEFRAWFTKGKSAGPARSTLKSKLKNITLNDNFPSPQVVQAYLEPTVEDSKEKFSWGKPDIAALTFFAKDKFGWTSRKTEEILSPVVKKLEESRSQKSIREYFKTKFVFESGGVQEKMSKRVRTAVDRFGKSKEELVADEMEELEKEKRGIIKKSPKNKRTNQQRKKEKATSANNEEENDTAGRSDAKRKKTGIVVDEEMEEPGKEKQGIIKKSPKNKLTNRQRKEEKATNANNEEETDTAGRSDTRKRTGTVVDDEMEELGKEKQGIIKKSPKNKRTNRRRKEEKATSANNEEETKTAERSETKAKKTEIVVDSAEEDLQPSKAPMKTTKNKKQATKETHNYTGKIKSNSFETTGATLESATPVDELKEYENLATQLRIRRRKKNELMKLKQEVPSKKTKLTALKQSASAAKNQEADEELQLLKATTSRSIRREQEIREELEKNFEREFNARSAPTLHKEEVIHQRLRSRSDLLRNKLRAIEVFRKSKKGPGFVQKRGRKQAPLKEDAGLSEDSDD